MLVTVRIPHADPLPVTSFERLGLQGMLGKKVLPTDLLRVTGPPVLNPGKEFSK